MLNFIFKPFNEMTDEDYQLVGFKSGLEIHQLLLTEKKLFCRCPAGKYNFEYNAEILRHMRPTLSELGEYDGTALMEFKTKKDIVYRINRESVCTYEMDDTPPFLINEQALDIALETAMLFNSNIVDELHIARKQYLDGSIPTGFQRTAIFSLNGEIPYKDRKISIIQQSIEEDSCREVSDIGHTRIYITDRLGMPLIETVTGPDMKTPREVAEVARICARVVRSTNKVRRGMGAAREDVNVSVEGGTRVEIKGVPKISTIPLLTYNEAKRQWNLLRLREELKDRGITPETFKAESADVTTLLKRPHYLPLKTAIYDGQRVMCVNLHGFKDLLHWETQTDTYFSKEISDRVRVIACLTTLPNIVHSDSKSDTLTSAEWALIKKHMNANESDTLVLVWGSEMDTDTAVKEITIRAKEATIGIPSETRQALDDGTNGFERILPGADRMYPDTDLPPKQITAERLEKIKKQLPEPIWERENWYRELKIPPDTIEELSIHPLAAVFKEAVEKMKIDPVLAAVVTIQWTKKLKKAGYDISLITDYMMREIFECYSSGIISREGIYLALKKSVELGKFYAELLPKPLTRSELKSIIKREKAYLNDMPLYDKSNYNKLLTGRVMDAVRGRIEFEKISQILDEHDKEAKNGK
ncbi:MAG: glutamyl-tRNA(Gln) amidotransferase subunit E [Melioribacteraceae bacterium]|nr:MAG: glutamyl-tRNA(Gln) amidotransferase subunit E [Melioribacteraceae bacterium]